MEAILDYLNELQSYWRSISFIGMLLVAERAASRWWPPYRAWSHKENRGKLVILTVVLVAICVFGFLAYRGERQKNIISIAVVIGQPGIVYNVNGIDTITAYLRIENYGQTIAGETTWEVGVNVLDIAVGEGSFAGLGEPQLREGPTAIPPGERVVRHPEVQWPSDANERAEIVKAIKKREKGIFVFGRINYVDARGTPWVSRFCRIYTGPNTYVYRKQTGPIPPEAYPDQEYVPCPNPDLSHVPRKIFKS